MGMENSRQQLGELVRAIREQREYSQESLAKQIQGCNRSAVAHLEQGLRLPRPDLLQGICGFLNLPRIYWEEFLDPEIQTRLDFEEQLEELCGRKVSLSGHDQTSRTVADRAIKKLFDGTRSDAQLQDLFNSVLVFYGVHPISADFYRQYLGANAFGSVNSFREAVLVYQQDVVRLFSNFEDGYEKLNACSARAEWKIPNDIDDERLPDLGYISAVRVKQESDERNALRSFLLNLAKSFRDDPGSAIAQVPEKTKRRMDTLLRKFDTHFEHGLFSPLFAPDADIIEREAARLAPKSDDEISRMEQTQRKAMENLAYYLASDFIDVYVATSMRSDADFVSVNSFVKSLFSHEQIKPLKLRHFNPTQSWIDDRIAKGLVEALMLRRAAATIYMAQKSDTFGKDSEASVALGQGKPVIVYVPRLNFPDGATDTETLFKKSKGELIDLLTPREREDVDETVDEQAIFGKVLNTALMKFDEGQLALLAQNHWADFDLFEELHRIPISHRADYRRWLDEATRTGASSISIGDFKDSIVGVFVSNAIAFERRAKLFREIHPLALQVILSSGVLNGILVVRTVEQCAEILSRLIKNDLQLDFTKDERNYRLVEKLTGSTIRVISRHRLLLNAFSVHYSKGDK
jgi:transcriptional regulator with XRE-family HTH domain